MKSHLVKILSTIFMVLLIAQGRLFAQKEANHWIFDVNTYLDFSSGTPVATVPPTGTCGTWSAPTCCFFHDNIASTSISNKNGDLLLYANNNVIYNSGFDTIQNGLINSNLFSKQCIIIPRPQRPNRYYVITTPWYMVSNGVRYTEVDIFANGGLGSAISVNTILLPNACQKVTAVYHENQIDIWLLVHQYHSNAFYAYLVTKNGINLSPVISNVGTSHTENPNTNWCYSDLAGNGEMKFSTDGDKVACAIKGLDIVEVFDFDNATGVLSNPVSLVCGEIESVEFSPDGTLLYTGSWPWAGNCNLILEGGSSKIYQFDLISEDSAAIVNSKTAISIQAFGWKKYLQLGPDMKIYSVSEFQEHLGVISSPNSTGILCDFDSIGFTLPTYYYAANRNSLPNFFRSPLDRNILFEDVCMGDTTLIFTLTNTNFDSIMWSFNDFQLGNQSIWNQDSVYFPFTRPGSYTIDLYRYRDGYQDKTSKTLNILPQLNISFSDTTVCQGSEYVFDLNSPYCNFGWINSASPDTFQTDSFIIQQNTMFWPVLLNHSDYCGSMDNIMISVYEDSLNLGNDISGMCINNPITLDAALSNATAYIWSDNSTLDQLVAMTSNLYSVTVTTQQGCTFMDTISLIYEPLPLASLDSIAFLCFDSVFTFFTNDTNFAYIWQPMGILGDSITIDSPGNYWIATTSSCGLFTDSIEVIELDVPHILLPLDTSICQGDSVFLNLESPYSTFSWNTGDTTSSIYFSDEGLYQVLVENYCGSDSDDYSLTLIYPQEIELGNDTIICQGDSIILGPPYNANTSYNWSNGETSHEILASEAGVYFLIAVDQCFEYTDTFQLLTHTNDFTFSEDTLQLDSTGIIIIEAGFGFDLYNWSTLEITESIEVTLSGIYWLEVIDSIGCKARDSVLVLPYLTTNHEEYENLTIFPNPFQERFSLELPIRFIGGTLEIFSISGQVIHFQHITISTENIHSKSFEKGVYLIKITSLTGESYLSRLVKL